jgi:hypothetical protein
MLALLASEVVRLTSHPSVSRATIGRRLAETDLKPWQEKMWCVPQIDPTYVARMEDVLELYTTLPRPGTAVVCGDERPQQLIGEVRPTSPPVVGSGWWGPELVKRRPEITMEMVEIFLTKMFRANPDFVYSVTRDFARNCQTPVLILPDDIPAQPYAVAMECAMLAPKAEVSMYPWKEPKERIPLAVRQIRSFLRAHRRASA